MSSKMHTWSRWFFAMRLPNVLGHLAHRDLLLLFRPRLVAAGFLSSPSSRQGSLVLLRNQMAPKPTLKLFIREPSWGALLRLSCGAFRVVARCCGAGPVAKPAQTTENLNMFTPLCERYFFTPLKAKFYKLDWLCLKDHHEFQALIQHVFLIHKESKLFTRRSRQFVSANIYFVKNLSRRPQRKLHRPNFSLFARPSSTAWGYLQHIQ